jgi:hypothetical protein
MCDIRRIAGEQIVDTDDPVSFEQEPVTEV